MIALNGALYYNIIVLECNVRNRRTYGKNK